MSHKRLWGIVLATAVLPSQPAQAQGLTPGRWSGIMKLAGGPSVPVTYVVEIADTSVTVMMNVIDGPPSSVTEIELEKDALAFRWTHLRCTLKRKSDFRYEGKCIAPDGAEAELRLVPPVDEQAANEDSEKGSKSNIVMTEDLVRTRASNVYDALQRLRPRWLRPRGPARSLYSISVHVYIDNQPVGDVEFLKTLEPHGVVEIRFYTASEANMRFGGNNEGGVIAVTQQR